MEYEVKFSADAERDFELIFEFLFDSYIAFGDSAAVAIDRAEARTQSIHTEIGTLSNFPRRTTPRDDIGPGLHCFTFDRAIAYFEVVEQKKTVRILAVFFGGQDHVRLMLTRLLRDR